MKRIAAFIAFTLALVLGSSALAAPASAAPEDDVATVIDRLEEYYLGQGDEIIIANGIYLARTSEALDYVASQNADGSWSDVNYADRTSSANGSVWSAYTALYRMLAMTQAYKDPNAEGFGDPRLVDAVGRALLHWDRVNPGNTNWWETEIGESIAMGRISMFLGSALSPEAFDVALKHNTGKLDPVGANGAWRTSNYIFEALSTRDIAKVKEGFATIVATIAVDHSGTVQEAVQPDGSFWAHGAQLYSEGYGMVLFTYAALWSDVARGTGLAFTRDQLDSIAFYFISGTRWLIRGEIGMLYLNYRPPKTVNDITSHASEFIEPLQRMARTDALYATAYQAVLDGVLGKTETNGVTGNKYFWRSEFSSHLRDGYGIFTRLNSSRTFGAELRTSYRDELGNPVYWNAMGSTAIQVNNREYLDLGPAFDWWHYPGVTAPNVKRTERGFENRGRNGDGGSFTGGTSNGEFGASVLTLDTAGTTAQKSYFSFDEGMVALGAGIASTSDAAVHTTINQAAAKPNASVGGRPVAGGTDQQGVGSATWAYNDEVGYVFAAGQDVKVSNKTQSGSWEGEEAISRDAFSLYVDHGAKPAAGTYDYTVLPAATPAEVEAYAAKPTIRTLRNDTAVQAVRSSDAGITMATFFAPGSLDLGDGRTLTVDQPSIVLLDERSDTPVVSLSNPDRAGLSVGVTLAGGGAEKHAVFRLGSGENLGKTVTAPLVDGTLPASSPFAASSTADGSSVDALGDRDTASVWRSAAGGTQWAAAALPRGSWVTKVTIDWADAHATDYVVQTSPNGVDWTDRANISGGDGGLDEVPITPTAAENVRVLLLGGEGAGYGIRELTVASSVNLAIDSATRASGYAGYNLVFSLADGDPDTRWRGNNADSAWAQIDLGSSKPVSTVRLSWEAAFAKTYKIQLSDDGRSWRDAYTTPSGGSDGGIDVITLDGQTARYVRMQTLTRALNYGPSLWEFEVFSDRLVVEAPAVPAANANLALGRPTTVDSVHQNNATITGPRATDGSKSTKWSSARAVAEHWLQVDLGSVRSVSRAVVAWEAGTSNDYRIEGSVDGATWRPLARVQTAQPTLTHTHDFAPAEVRYARLAGLPSTQYGLNIWEFELYGGYTFECTGPVTAPRDSTAVVAATVSPVAPDDVFTAISMDESIVTVAGEARVSPDGRVEVDLQAREPGRTTVGIRHQGGTEIAWCGVTVDADTSRLQAQIDAANALDSTAYTPESWAPLLPALEAAKQVRGTPGAPQEDADAAAAALEAALAGLVRLDAVSSAPRDVVATASRDVVTVQWSAPERLGGSPVTAYEVTVGDHVVQVEDGALTASVADLAPGDYGVTVRAQNVGGWSEPSAPVTVTVDPDVVAPVVTVEGSPKVGGRIDMTGSGFEPGVEYVIQLRSTPADLGVVIADDDGAIAFRGVVPEDTDPGEHTIVVMQADADIASTPVLILAADEPGVPGGPGTPGTPGGGTPGGGTPGGGAEGPGGLPATGGDLTWLPWTLAIALLLLGSGAVAVRLRRGATTD
ncbi:galactose-binding domain-containing protein [Microbacterium galbinum]|uniref:Discoidin domain-containing protein n=1 Tax=Microbacterium galbinum TaxID=2851646 RepID=A0ABY4IRV9_9MICO|nr:discoidin domain-containing protein [Microbacterium galbinum]UPL14390.1 discoidin domain-containing protein [Microbacterium galbinum]